MSVACSSSPLLSSRLLSSSPLLSSPLLVSPLLVSSPLLLSSPPPRAQPRPSTHSVLCRTSTTTIHAQCSLPDLKHDHPRPVFPAGPQPRPSTPSVPCRTSTAEQLRLKEKAPMITQPLLHAQRAAMTNDK